MMHSTSCDQAPQNSILATLQVCLFLIMFMAYLTPPAFAKDEKPPVTSLNSTPQRNFRTFLPKAGEPIDEPSTQLVQILLDRQTQGEVESYMIQVLFRGPPSERNVKILEDRIVIDFFDTGKPAMRLSKIRGGAIEANSLEEFFYKDAAMKGTKQDAKSTKPAVRIKKLVRLTLFIHKKVGDLKFRDTLDRTLIHFRLP